MAFATRLARFMPGRSSVAVFAAAVGSTQPRYSKMIINPRGRRWRADQHYALSYELIDVPFGRPVSSSDGKSIGIESPGRIESTGIADRSYSFRFDTVRR